MFIVGTDVTAATTRAVDLAVLLAGQVADLEATPWAVGDIALRHDLTDVVTGLRRQAHEMREFAAALGATPRQLTSVDVALARRIALTRPPDALAALSAHALELAGTLAAEGIIHALPPETLRAVDPLAAAIPDGPGWAVPQGEPVPLAASPRSAADWFTTVADAQAGPGQIEVTALDNGRWVVSLPGIHSFGEAADPLDLPGAAHAFGTGHGAYAGAVVMALTLARVPHGARLMVVGHSQGGIVAADLAADPAVADRWQITQLLTAAAPIDNTGLPATTGVLALRNRDDVVPALDLRASDATPPVNMVLSHTGGDGHESSPAARATIAFDAEQGTIGANHDLAATYVPFARSSGFAANPAVRAWEQAAAPYLTGAAATTQRFQLFDRTPAPPAVRPGPGHAPTPPPAQTPGPKAMTPDRE